MGGGSAGYAIISYASADSGMADEVQAALEAAGIRVWRDTEIEPGESWRDRIRQAISGNSLAFLACFSRAGLAARRSVQNEELRWAVDELAQRKPGVPWLIPVRFDDCEIPDLGIGAGQTIRSLRPADVFGEKRNEELARLVTAVASILGRAGTGLPVEILQAAQIAPEGRVVVGDIPQRPTAFVDRSGLQDALTGGSAGAVWVVYAVTGLRGVGKTQAAAECARQRLAQGWPVVAWVDASSRDSLLAGYAELARGLGLAGDGLDLMAVAGRVRRWLEAGGEKCLVVLDNADSADVLRRFLPAAGAAQVILTSSRTTLAALGRAVPVDVFTEAEAVSYLTERTELADDQGALEVARELGCLPLALAQAGAVIAGQQLDYRVYLRRLAAVTVEEYLPRPEEDPYPSGTAQAIILAVEAAGAGDASTAAGRVLAVLALMSPAGVPRNMLAAAAGLDEAAMDEVLGQLAGWSVLSFSVDRTMVQAHRLVLRVVRERAAGDGALAAAASSVVGALARMLPGEDSWRHPYLARELVVQFSAVAGYLQDIQGLLDASSQDTFLSLQVWAGWWYLTEIPELPRALALLQRSLADHGRVLGPDHPRSLDCRSLLARAYQEVGQVDLAVALFEQTLTDRQRVLGPDHPDTLGSSNNLASALRAAGKLDQALALHEQNLADCRRVLGPGHRRTLSASHNLANAYQDAGQPDQAIALHEQNLASYERTSGPGHPDTLRARNNLAISYQVTGDADRAIALHERSLSDYRKILGPDHPNALGAGNNLALAYRKAGHLDRAIALQEQNLADRQRVLGPDHPDTLESCGNLARAYRDAGQFVQATALAEQAFEDSQRVLGTQHPHTLAAGRNLASIYLDAGRPGQAASILPPLAADAERVLGGAHPLTELIRQLLGRLKGLA